MATRKTRRRQKDVEDLTRTMSRSQGSGQKSYRVTLERSAIGQTERQRATLKCLGLRGRGTQVVVTDTPQTRGRIRAVAHLVGVEEV